MGEPLLVHDAQVDERHSRAIDQLTGLPHRAVLSVPLVSKSDVFGVLQLVDTVPGRFELSELRMAESLASIAAIAIENALLFRAVSQQRGQLRALTVRLGEVQETERQQLAGELHDRIGQNLTALSLNLTIIDQLLPANTSPAVHRRIEDSAGILGETARRVRNVMAELRPPMLDDYGLLPALRWVGEQFVTRTGIAVRVDGPATELRLPLRLETALCRIAQEALNNVAKHARAHEVRITLEPTDRRVRLSIADDGVGFDVIAMQRNVDTPHWGMLTMQERAASMGGTVRLDSTPGHGTRSRRGDRDAKTMIRVLIADDHAVVRDGLCYLLEAQPDLSVVGDAANGREAVARTIQLKPDVVLMDISMPELNGIDATAQIIQAVPETSVIILSMQGTRGQIFRALQAGAQGYVLKDSAGRVVVEAVRAVHGGSRYFSDDIMSTLVTDYMQQRQDEPAKSPLERLSEREREILIFVVEGKSSVEIGEILSLSPRTVETYRSRLMQKLGLKDLPSLVKFAVQHGLTSLD